MYFKIENKKSELYISVMSYIEGRRKARKNIFESVEIYFGMKFKTLLMYEGGLNCLPTIKGIPLDSEINLQQGMKPAKIEDCQEPDVRTKRGKEIRDFFSDLPNWSFYKELDLFPCKRNAVGRFKIPYVESFNGIIVVSIDENFKPKETEDFIEITTSEFKRITKSK